jgi:hypothetical protein
MGPSLADLKILLYLLFSSSSERVPSQEEVAWLDGLGSSAV